MNLNKTTKKYNNEMSHTLKNVIMFQLNSMDLHQINVIVIKIDIWQNDKLNNVNT
jgi:hypothetical protein